jgi:hypothetical protein
MYTIYRFQRRLGISLGVSRACALEGDERALRCRLGHPFFFLFFFFFEARGGSSMHVTSQNSNCKARSMLSGPQDIAARVVSSTTSPEKRSRTHTRLRAALSRVLHAEVGGGVAHVSDTFLRAKFGLSRFSGIPKCANS